MPHNIKPAPAQQSSLAEMWGKKKAKPEESKKRKEVDEDEERQPRLEEEDNAPVKTEVDVKADDRPPAPKRKEDRPASDSAKPKRRKIIESDEEPGTAPEVAPIPSKRVSSKPRSKSSTRLPPPPSSPPQTSQPSSSQPKPIKSSARPKGKVPKVIEEEERSDEGNVAAATSAGEEEAEEEGDEDGEPDLDLDEEATSKVAETALSKVELVDIKGGWKVGEPIPYAALAKAFALIEGTTKRLEKTALLTSFLFLVIQRSQKGDTKSLLQSVYLCINRLSPDYVGIELGIGESLLMKAIGESTGRSLAVVKADLKKEGDLGLVAMNSKNSQKTLFKPKPLTVPFVFSNLKEIALSSGHSSQAKKVSIITKLLASCQGTEAKYIIRSLEGKLRIGNAEKTVLVALAHAAVLADKERSNKRWSQEKLVERLEQAASTIKTAYSELPSYDLVIPALLTSGVYDLPTHCKLTPGVPLKPMLAKPTKAIGEVLDRFEGKRFTCEYKYDGERAQVHKLPDGTVAVFSRNSEDMSKKYPDLVEQLPRCIKQSTRSFVLDAEAVAIDRATGKLMPFQELSRRKRKDVKVEDIQVKVCLFGFDLLFLNGEPLLKKSLQERRELLRTHFQIVSGEFDFAKSSDSASVEEIQAFLEESVRDGCEGLMVKMLESDASFYEPSRRSINWLKIKKDYLAGVGDSLDLVVVGAYHGKGKRTNVYGAFLLACYDSDSEQFQTICKIGTGFSDEALQSHYETLHPLEVTKARGDVTVGGAKPDVWFEPRVVWEVLTADLSLSPVYTAAQGLVDERGISLRFPRFLRIRDDKNADDATGPEQVAEMYERQALAPLKGGKKKKGGDGDDGFW